MSEAVIVVGDIHGDASRLAALLPILETSERPAIFVGDYVNSGPDSSGVIDLLCEAQRSSPDRFVFLAGNHEIALLEYLEHGDFARFAAMGGIPTIRSYLPDVRGDVHASFTGSVPAHHRAFLRALRPCWESEDVLVSHAGYDPARPSERTIDAMVTGSWPAIFRHGEPPRPLVVCGHYLQTSAKPFIGRHLVCLDTGCGVRGGPLTAMKLPERELITI